MNYYPFHIGDYVSATRHLSWEEDAAYRRLLDTYYTTEKALPVDLRAVCRLVLATTETQREAVRVVLEEFFELTEEGWINSRADKEIDAMREKQQKQRDRAIKRWHKPVAEPGNAPAMPRHDESHATASQTNANALPPTPTPTPTPIPKEEKESRSQATRPPSRPKSEAITLTTYLANCKAAGQKPVPDGHAIRRWCADAGIVPEMLQIAWVLFRDRYTEGEKGKLKRYKDWPGHFATAVKDNWAGLWFMGDDGKPAWTSKGLTHKAVLDARLGQKEAAHG